MWLFHAVPTIQVCSPLLVHIESDRCQGIEKASLIDWIQLPSDSEGHGSVLLLLFLLILLISTVPIGRDTSFIVVVDWIAVCLNVSFVLFCSVCKFVGSPLPPPPPPLRKLCRSSLIIALISGCCCILYQLQWPSTWSCCTLVNCCGLAAVPQTTSMKCSQCSRSRAGTGSTELNVYP